MTKIKLSNANGKTLTIENSDSGLVDRTLDGNLITTIRDVVVPIKDRNTLHSYKGTLGDIVKQVDIALDYKWVEPQQADNGGTIINVTGDTTGSWVALTKVLMITNLPISDPLVIGQLWNNSGAVTVSAG